MCERGKEGEIYQNHETCFSIWISLATYLPWPQCLSPLLVRSQLGRQNHITFSPLRRTLRALGLRQQPRRAQEHEANTNEIQRQGVRCPEQQTHAITITGDPARNVGVGKIKRKQAEGVHRFYHIILLKPHSLQKPIVEKRAGSRDIKSAWPPLQLHIIHPKILPWCLLGQIFQQDPPSPLKEAWAKGHLLSLQFNLDGIKFENPFLFLLVFVPYPSLADGSVSKQYTPNPLASHHFLEWNDHKFTHAKFSDTPRDSILWVTLFISRQYSLAESPVLSIAHWTKHSLKDEQINPCLWICRGGPYKNTTCSQQISPQAITFSKARMLMILLPKDIFTSELRYQITQIWNDFILAMFWEDSHRQNIQRKRGFLK